MASRPFNSIPGVTMNQFNPFAPPEPSVVLTTIISTLLVSTTPTSKSTPVVTSLVVTTAVGTSSSTSGSTSQSALPQSDNSGGGLSMGSIIGLSVAVGVAVIGLIAFFIWKLRRKCFSDFDGPDLNTRGGVTALSEMSNTVPSPDVVTPFIIPPSKATSILSLNYYTSNGQSLPSQSIPSKFSHGNQPSEPSATRSTSSNGGIQPSTPLRPQFSSPASISSSSPPRLPLSGSQTNLDITSPRVPQVTTEQRSPSPQLEGATANFEFVRHEDSGVRIPLARNNFVELPPFYTPG